MGKITDADTVYGPGAGHLHDLNIGGNPYPYGECTWYIWQFYHDTQGVNIAANLGNATDWVTGAHRETYDVDNNPVAGKTVSWSAAKYPPFGHVAVVEKVNGDGSFDVLEMNFTYFADENEKLAGKIDRRTVKDKDGIQGFITPHGVHVSNQNNQQDPNFLGLKSIGDAISQAGLYLEAQAMTAEHKLMSMAQVGAGIVISGAGGGLMVLTLAGKGDPGQGYSAIKSKVRRKPKKAAIPVDKAYRDAEMAWLSRAAKLEMAQNKRIAMQRTSLTNPSRSDIARDRRLMIERNNIRNLARERSKPSTDQIPF